MIDKIRNEVKLMRGTKVNITINNIRNKKEEVSGIIDELYKRIFTVKCSDNLVRSFNYIDILTGYIKIDKY